MEVTLGDNLNDNDEPTAEDLDEAFCDAQFAKAEAEIKSAFLMTECRKEFNTPVNETAQARLKAMIEASANLSPRKRK